MAWLKRFVLCVFLVHPAQADPLPGAEVPALHAAFDRLLAGDDPAALTALHDLAQSGNVAALITLVSVQSWFSAAAGEMVGNQIEEFARAAFKPVDLWRGGEASYSGRDQLNRALWLYELGEDGKADYLLADWVGRMPKSAALPEGFQDLAADPGLLAQILLQHVNRGDRKALPVLQDWLDHDRIEGWIVYAELSDHYVSAGGQPMVSALRIAPTVRERLPDGRRAARFLRRLDFAQVVDAKTVAMVQRDLLPRASFAPVRAYCAARCPSTKTECAAAFVGVLGRPRATTALGTPFKAVMAQDRFFATLRGEQVLLGWALRSGAGRDAAAANSVADPTYLAAKLRDSCFADGVLRALQPFPPGP